MQVGRLYNGLSRSDKSKVLERNLIGSRIIKTSVLHMFQSAGSASYLHQFGLLHSFSLLLLRLVLVAYLVARRCSEGKLVNWELGFLFYVVIVCSILPVWKILLILACQNHWPRIDDSLLEFLIGSLANLSVVHIFLLSSKIHLVRVDYFGFFLQIECLLVISVDRCLLREFSLIVRLG